MWQKIKQTFVMYRNTVVLILLCASLMANIGLLLGKGLVFNMKSEAISNAYSNASSASLMIAGLGDAQNKKWMVKYKMVEIPILSRSYGECVTEFLNTLTPLQYCFTKVYGVHVIYPEFEEKK